MSHTRHSRLIGRVAALLAGLTTLTAAALSAVAPAAFAMRLPPGGATGPMPPATSARTLVVGGMPGWQIVLIALGAALTAAAAAVLLDRTRTARRRRPAAA